jgi:putative glutamine amidotransferase
VNDLTLPLPMTRSLNTPRKPVILVPACNRMLGEHPFHIAGKKYLDAALLAGGMPLIVPSVEPDDIDALLDLADGVLLTGSPSNVHPSHYGQDVHNPDLPQDPLRDSWTLPLIRAVVDRGMPLFAICRGFQETNVALGGSLFQAVHEVAGYQDHRARDGAPAPEAYGAAHPVHAVAGGLLASIVGTQTFPVNSVHGQAVDRLAQGLRVEATAPDGLVEAFSVARSPGFSLCVQWHPEWQAAQNPQSVAMLQAFGQACAAWRDRHRVSTTAAR